jgi:hypothetical protein
VGHTTRATVLVCCLSLCLAMVLGVGGAPVAAQTQLKAPAHPQLQAAAVLTVISGDVLMRFGVSSFSSAADGAILYVGSTVRTSSDARAVITLFEGSTVELEPASDITIEQAAMRGGSTIVQLAQSLGRSWHVVTHLTTADSRYELRTPAATASVRGTTFEVAVDGAPGGTTTTVTTTEGRVATADAAALSEVLVSADQTTTVRANSAPEPPRAASHPKRVVTVSAMSESSIVVDPHGRANGIRNGKVFAQTPGARVRVEDGTIVITLPNVPEGVFATTVAASAGTPVAVSTTVTDSGEEGVTVINAAEPGSDSTTSGVELRRSGDKLEIRALTAGETRHLPDAKLSPNNKTSLRPSSLPTQRAQPTPAGRSQLNKSESVQPAPTSRRTAPTASPVRR